MTHDPFQVNKQQAGVCLFVHFGENLSENVSQAKNAYKACSDLPCPNNTFDLYSFKVNIYTALEFLLANIQDLQSSLISALRLSNSANDPGHLGG